MGDRSVGVRESLLCQLGDLQIDLTPDAAQNSFSTEYDSGRRQRVNPPSGLGHMGPDDGIPLDCRLFPPAAIQFITAVGAKAFYRVTAASNLS